MSVLLPPSSVRQNYATECEVAVNMLIKLELHTSNVYKSMSDYFVQNEVAPKSFSRYFLQLSSGAQGQAEKLTQLQSLRGSQLRFDKIQYLNDNWESGLKAMEFALMLERNINKHLLDLHRLATDLHDGHLRGYLQKYFLPQQAQSIKELAGHIYKLRKVRAPEAAMAKYLFNDLTMCDGEKKD